MPVQLILLKVQTFKKEEMKLKPLKSRNLMPFFSCLLVKIAKIKPREIKYQEGTRSPGARETWD